MVHYKISKGIILLLAGTVFLLGTNHRVHAIEIKNTTMSYFTLPAVHSKQEDDTTYNRLQLLKRIKLFPVRELQARQYHSSDHDNLCDVNKQELDPRRHFKTSDKFFPARYTSRSCRGSIDSKRGYPVCLYGVMDCVTIRQDISFMRMPSADCSTWYHDIIRDVPVGCACMLPR